MPVSCPKCGTTFGDLQNRDGPEWCNAFDEIVRAYLCPKCGNRFTNMDDPLAEDDEETEEAS